MLPILQLYYLFPLGFGLSTNPLYQQEKRNNEL